LRSSTGGSWQSATTLAGGTQSLLWNAENKLSQISGFGDGSGPIAGLSGKCLDDAGSSTADGNPVQLYSCNNTLAQQWKLTGDTLQVLGKCAAANGTANGTKILLATCDGSAAQKFTVRSADQSLYNLRVPKTPSMACDVQVFANGR
jgi:hypothetical protein